MSDEDEDDLELTPFHLLVLRKLGTLCHNRRTTTKELGEAMDASTARAAGWLRELTELGLVEREGVQPAFSFFPTPEGWQEIEQSFLPREWG